MLCQASAPRNTKDVDLAVITEFAHQAIGETSEMAKAIGKNCAWRSARAWYVKRDNLDLRNGLNEGLEQFEIGTDSIADEKRDAGCRMTRRRATRKTWPSTSIRRTAWNALRAGWTPFG